MVYWAFKWWSQEGSIDIDEAWKGTHLKKRNKKRSIINSSFYIGLTTYTTLIGWLKVVICNKLGNIFLVIKKVRRNNVKQDWKSFQSPRRRRIADGYNGFKNDMVTTMTLTLIWRESGKSLTIIWQESGENLARIWQKTAKIETKRDQRRETTNLTINFQTET